MPLVVKILSEAIFSNKKDPQPNRLRVFQSLIINALRTEAKLDKQLEIIKGRKRKYINMLAEEIITQEEYRENVEANNIEINELADKKNDLLTAMEGEQTGDNIKKLKQELLQFLNSDELTPEILHRFINRNEVKDDGTPFIHYRFSASIPD